LAFGAGVSDEALFNQIISSQQNRLNLQNQSAQQQDRNLGAENKMNNSGVKRNVPAQMMQRQQYQQPGIPPLNAHQQQQFTDNGLLPVPKEIPIYGHDLFGTSETFSSDTQQTGANSSQFVGDQNANVPDDYVLGSGDTVRIQTWGRVSKTEDLSLDRSGEVFSETFGKIVLGGQTYGQAQKIIAKMSDGMEGVSSSLVISNTKTVKVLVSGSVEKPGYYIMNVFGNITQAIVNAGGVKDFADIRRVAVVRGGKTVEKIDYYELLNNGYYRPKIEKLMPNDIIFVPRTTKRVLVEGAVKIEAYYDLKNESNINDVLKLAGGITSKAVGSNIVVTRVNKKDLKMTVKSIDISKGRDAAFRIEDGDKVTVYSVNEESINSIKLSGNVSNPGDYEFRSGIKISDIIKNADSILPDTELDSSFVVRRNSLTSETVIIPFSLKKIFENSKSPQNILLQPYDEIVVVGKYQVMDNVNIDVSGEVVTAGDYKAEKNSTVYDMIVKAGGFTSSSDKKSIEIVDFVNDRYSSEYIDINKAMSTKAPLQGFIVVHGIYESALMDYIEVSGDILNPGEFFFYQGMTLSEILQKAVSKDRGNQKYTVIIYRMNQDRGGSEVIGMDLRSIYDSKTNYIMKQGDRVVVKLVSKEVKRYVNIEGSVFDPGTYLYAENLTVKQLMVMAGGQKDSAFMDSVEIVRKEISQGYVDQKYIKIDKQDIESFKLMPGDRVVIRDISEYNKMEYVTLTGEFKFPGKYPIKKGEKLSSIIERAGGFTDSAYLNGTVFTRLRVRLEKQAMLDKMVTSLERDILVNANMEAMTASTTMGVDSSELMLKTKDQFVNSIKKLKADGRLVLKMSHPRLLKGSANDIELENGDIINIPKVPGTVVVSGSVLSPGAFVYNPKMEWEDYLKMTGGLLSQADKKNIFIMKVDGTAQKVNSGALSWSPENDRWEVSYFSKEQPLNPGDTIVVPDNYNRIPWMRNIKDITQIMMQIAVTAGVLTNL
jgi:protein involved in polysaccharide export with SLBB domain